MNKRGVVAVDLGGTRLRVAVFDGEAEMRHKNVLATPPGDPGALPRAIRDAILRSDIEVAGAVVGVPGSVSYDAAVVEQLTNLPAWGSISAAELAEETAVPVLLANDADLAALGEHRYGAGQGVSDMLYVTASTGVGGGVIIGGRLLRAHRSLAEGGHMVIDRATGATVEDLGSGTAIERAAAVDDAAIVTERALKGDERSLAIMRDAAEALAIGVQNMVLCFMPQRVVIGGGVSSAGELLLAPVRRRLDECALCSAGGEDVVIANGGDDVGLMGAFALWMDSMEDGRSTVG